MSHPDPLRFTERDFADLSWHDCHFWGFDIRAGDPADDDWTSDLELRIDWISSWSCGGPEAEFRVAPALLTFHGVTGLRFAIEADDPELRIAIGPWSIDRVEREGIDDAKVYLDRPYYLWRICLNLPAGGEISFGAWGFSQHVLGDGLVLVGRQHLTMRERRRLLESDL